MAYLVFQDETDPELLDAQAHMLEVLGCTQKTNTEGDGGDGGSTINKIHFGELNDALTSMRAHKKKIDPNLTALDLDLVNRIVRNCFSHMHNCLVSQEPEFCQLRAHQLQHAEITDF